VPAVVVLAMVVVVAKCVGEILAGEFCAWNYSCVPGEWITDRHRR